ncbi:MAG: competence/damage-inducible protein A [Oscillospiraceae bacterium]|jgi:nicotinamide-nucleotide amidase
MTTHTAEIIGVGTELLLGNVANTDAQLISQGLSELGINVFYHTVVGDNPARLRAAVDIARRRADIIITTGGLGPTCDDLTKQTVAESFGRKMVFHEDIAEHIRSYFKDNLHALKMTENNLQQASFPEGSIILQNDRGTAPGCAFSDGKNHVIMLPGPPRECCAMFYKAAVPYLRSLSDSVIVSSNIRIFGSGESSVESKLRDLMNSLHNPTLAPYAKEGEVMLRATAKARTESEAREMLVPVINKVREVIGDKIYGIDVNSLEEVVVSGMREKGLTLAVAESCTGGLVTKRITDIPGCSDIFLGGVTAYATKVKTSILGVPEETISKNSVVSPEVALAMAEGVKKALGADVAVGITGIAGPSDAGIKKPIGNVYVALVSEQLCCCRELFLGEDRYRVRMMAANVALDMVRRFLQNLPIE